MTLVVDASVAIKWFVDENLHIEARRIFEYQPDFVAPDLLLAEVANIAWKKVLRSESDDDQARFIVTAMPSYVPRLIPVADLVGKATDLALELGHPVYDCLYLACAQDFGSCVTADRRFFDRVKRSPYARFVAFVDDPELQRPRRRP